MHRIITILLLSIAPLAYATPEEAQRIQRGYELHTETWSLKYKLATTPEERNALQASRPNPTATANELFRTIAPTLQADWAIPYAAFFLELTQNLTAPDANGNMTPAFTEERKRIIQAFIAYHLGKPGIEPIIIALSGIEDPQALSILEKIANEHPNTGTQGIAALGAALALSRLGDERELMEKRLTFLRKAIIQASELKVGDTTVADVAAEQLYIIQHLIKGRSAPEFTGTDVAGRILKLSDFRGKIVVLLFWDAQNPDTDRIIELTNRLTQKNIGKPVAVIGITPESATRIEELQGDDSIKWNNIADPKNELAGAYRIVSRPAVMVIDAKGVIEYTGLPGTFVDLTVDALLTGNAE
ncbi:MAG: redoxin domain-containing protein [Akkermansiaceae bacterium]|jgi:peroxiredoxin|nr:redoxin domain-containing protein [Akkermansiaceae bacterium]